jgi:hypothetical protein
MSREEVVSAYLDGRISRRTLIRRLVAAGVSAGAAVSYAHLLAPERATAAGDSDHYPDVTVNIVKEDLNRVINRGRILVRVHADGDSQLHPFQMTATLLRQGHAPFLLGDFDGDFVGPDTKTLKIPLTTEGHQKLQGRSAARIQVTWRGYDNTGQVALPNGYDIARLTA